MLLVCLYHRASRNRETVNFKVRKLKETRFSFLRAQRTGSVHSIGAKASQVFPHRDAPGLSRSSGAGMVGLGGLNYATAGRSRGNEHRSSSPLPALPRAQRLPEAKPRGTGRQERVPPPLLNRQQPPAHQVLFKEAGGDVGLWVGKGFISSDEVNL